MRFTLLLIILALALSAKNIQVGKVPGISGHKKIVLTFDDGPNSHDSTTLKLLAVLKKHNVKAHFSLIGENMLHAPEVVQAIAAEKHPISLHSMKDKSLYFKDSTFCSKDLEQFQKQLDAILGTPYKLKFCRPPYGFYAEGFEKIAQRDSLFILPISVYHLDAENGSMGANKVIKKSMKYVKKHKGGVLVFHDGKDHWLKMAQKMENKSNYDRRWIVSAIDRFISEMKKEGFEFVLF